MGKFGYGKRNKKKRLSNNHLTGDDIKPRNIATGNYVPIELKNDLFESYYRGKIIPDSEWSEFIEIMKEQLPVTFRLSSPTPDGDILASNLEKYLVDNFPFLERIEWYPTPGSAWKVSAGRSQVRKDSQYASLHSVLVRETEVGTICRQEAVSMIPPLFLQVSPSDSVLDMCAAPGSKTCQLIEHMHASSENSILPDGVVVANDVDGDRASMMVHQVKRMHSPCLVVTTTDASQFPKATLFDKILCDVPCSGDGTLRKNKLIWKTWHPKHAEALHSLQVSILERGLSLLRPGGKLVYSTCSLNPVENEQVIEEVLSKLDLGEYQLLDCSNHLPNLKRRPGISAYSTNLPLERCMRFYPHLQDTGGFFVAIIEKRFKSQPDETLNSSLDPASNCIKNMADHHTSSDDNSDLQPSSIALEQWGIDKNILQKNIIFRQQYPQDKEKNLLPQLSIISTKAKRFLEIASNLRSLPVLYTGLAAFSRQDGNESYRIKYPAIPYLVPFLDHSKIINLTESSDILLLLSPIESSNKSNATPMNTDGSLDKSQDTNSVNLNESKDTLLSIDVKGTTLLTDDKINATSTLLTDNAFSSSSTGGNVSNPMSRDKNTLNTNYTNQAVKFDSLSSSLQMVLMPLPIGCHAARIIGNNCSTSVPLWKGRSSVHLLVGKMDKASLLFHWMMLLRK